MGMITIDHEQLKELKCQSTATCTRRTPSTYEIAKQNNIELIDASCPVVLDYRRRSEKI